MIGREGEREREALIRSGIGVGSAVLKVKANGPSRRARRHNKSLEDQIKSQYLHLTCNCDEAKKSRFMAAGAFCK